MKQFRNTDYYITPEGNVIRNNRTLKPLKRANGYVFVWIYTEGSKRRYSIHRLVGECYVPNPENKPVINHKNGDKKDNRADNLEWTTHSENAKHAIEIGMRTYNKSFSTTEAIDLRNKGYSYRQIGKILQVHFTSIYRELKDIKQ